MKMMYMMMIWWLCLLTIDNNNNDGDLINYPPHAKKYLNYVSCYRRNSSTYDDDIE